MAQLLQRTIEIPLKETLIQGKSILLLGARQVGKTTLLKQLEIDFYMTFADPLVRQETEKHLDILKQRIIALKTRLKRIPLVVIDEVQKVPEVMDLVQYLIDEKVGQFILTGSSARKLKRPGKINLLPGRVALFYLDPFSLLEIAPHDAQLSNLLLYGTLPEIYLSAQTDLKERLLQSYVMTYLEEEIRSEALVRDLGHFSQFLELAAIESGNTINLSKISQEIGVAHSTISHYYQILEDCLIAFRIEPFIGKTTRKLLKSPKYLFFDMGIKRLCAHESLKPTNVMLSHMFEQFVGLELCRYKNLSLQNVHLKYWRSYDGPEVDWIIETPDAIIPVEVKYTKMPTLKDARHLNLFMKEHPQVQQCYIVCTTDFTFNVTEKVTAIPWQELPTLLQ